MGFIAPYGGVIAVFILVAVLPIAVLGLFAGVRLRQGPRRTPGNWLSAISAIVLILAGGMLIAAFKPKPHRDFGIDFRSPASVSKLRDHVHCHDAAHGRESYCVSSDYINSLDIVLPDGVEIHSEGQDLVFGLNRSTGKIQTFSFRSSQSLSGTEASALVRSEVPRWMDKALNPIQIAQKQQDTLAWIASVDPQKNRETAVCAHRADYRMCIRLQAVEPQGPLSWQYEIGSEAGLNPTGTFVP